MHVHLAIWLFIHILDAFSFFAGTPLTSCLFGCYCDELFAQKSPPSSALATLTTHSIPLGCKKCKKIMPNNHRVNGINCRVVKRGCKAFMPLKHPEMIHQKICESF